MTELQKTEFDILKTFTEICSELQLPYFLVCGSALGAAKYCGFIPWDDDVDVALLRPDYETFCEKAPPLTFNTGGSPEIIDNKTGAVVPTDDVKALTEEIIRIKEEKPFSEDACLNICVSI